MLLAQQSAKGNCICWALVLPQHFPDVYRIRAGGDDIRSEVKISFGFGWRNGTTNNRGRAQFNTNFGVAVILDFPWRHLKFITFYIRTRERERCVCEGKGKFNWTPKGDLEGGWNEASLQSPLHFLGRRRHPTRHTPTTTTESTSSVSGLIEWHWKWERQTGNSIFTFHPREKLTCSISIFQMIKRQSVPPPPSSI